MKIQSEDLIQEYFLKISSQYPDYTYEEIKEIVLHEWKFVKKVMSSDEIPRIRLKFFGVFNVSLPGIKGNLKALPILFDKGAITSQRYFEKKKMLEEYLEKSETDFYYRKRNKKKDEIIRENIEKRNQV